MAKSSEIAAIERAVDDAHELTRENDRLRELVRLLEGSQARQDAEIERLTDIELRTRQYAEKLFMENQGLTRRAEEAEAARDVWRDRHETLAESVRQSQQAMAAMKARDDARFAQTARSGE